MQTRPPWSDRRRRTLVGLALGVVGCGLAAIGLPGEYGAKAALVAALCAFLLLTATVVFLIVPGPGTLGTLLRSVPLAGACLVVAVLLLLSTEEDLRWLWWTTVLVTAGWTAAAVWQTRRPEA